MNLKELYLETVKKGATFVISIFIFILFLKNVFFYFC